MLTSTHFKCRSPSHLAALVLWLMLLVGSHVGRAHPDYCAGKDLTFVAAQTGTCVTENPCTCEECTKVGSQPIIDAATPSSTCLDNYNLYCPWINCCEACRTPRRDFVECTIFSPYFGTGQPLEFCRFTCDSFPVKTSSGSECPSDNNNDGGDDANDVGNIDSGDGDGEGNNDGGGDGGNGSGASHMLKAVPVKTVVAASAIAVGMSALAGN